MVAELQDRPGFEIRHLPVADLVAGQLFHRRFSRLLIQLEARVPFVASRGEIPNLSPTV